MSVRVVFDCMVYLQAAISDAGPASACLRLAEAGRLTLYLDRETLAEARDVLGRAGLRKKFPRLTDDLVAVFLGQVEAIGSMLDHVPQVYTLERDPDDEPYINLAIAAQASYLVSRDRDLLDLMDDPAFRARFPDLSVVDPSALLRALGSSGPSE